MSKKKRMSDAHAAARLVQRLGGDVSMERLRERVQGGEMEFMKRQSTSRSICRVLIDGSWIYMVINRKTRSIITVLDEDQGRARLLADGVQV